MVLLTIHAWKYDVYNQTSYAENVLLLFKVETDAAASEWRIWTKPLFQNGVRGCRSCVAITMETRLWGIEPDVTCIKRFITGLYIIDHCLNPNPNPKPLSKFTPTPPFWNSGLGPKPVCY